MDYRGYWTDQSEYDTHEFDKGLCDKLIKDAEHGLRWVDIGCGNGAYTFALRDAGINCIGYDGNPITEQSTNGICKIMDFSIPQQIGKFDVVLSLEVGEHIPKEFESVFLNNLRDASSLWIVLSWAVKGQPGTGHVNCQDNDYIISEMDKRSFVYCPEASQVLRDKSKLPWLKNTIMVFQKWLNYF